MAIGNALPHRDPEGSANTSKPRRVDAIGWAFLLIWIGIAILARIPWGWALLGISGIILGSQAQLWRSNEAVSGVAVACGIAFLVGGIWEAFGLTWPLAPVLLILLGAGLLWNALFGARTQ